MTRRFLATILAGLAAIGTAAPASEPVPPVESFSAAYDIHIGGLEAGALSVEATIGDARYAASARMRTSGLVGFFLDESWRGETEGAVREGRLRPLRYSSGKAGERGAQRRELGYEDDAPVSVRSEPEAAEHPWSVDAADQQGTVDPVTALVSMLAPAAEGEACDRRILAYDGEHRFAFELGPAERRGDRLACEGAYVRLGGYEPTALTGEDGRQPFTLVLAERADGLLQARRIEAETGFGAGVLRRRE